MRRLSEPPSKRTEFFGDDGRIDLLVGFRTENGWEKIWMDAARKNIRVGDGQRAAAAIAGGLPVAASISASAQEFPSRPIEFVVPWGPGGGADQVARKLAKLMEPKLKVSMPVINVPGATGQTGLTKMLTAPADGYSVSVFIGDTFALQAGTPPPKWTTQEVQPLGVVIQQPSAFRWRHRFTTERVFPGQS